MADSHAKAGDRVLVLVTNNQRGHYHDHHIAGEKLTVGELLVLKPYRPWWAFWRPHEQRVYSA